MDDPTDGEERKRKIGSEDPTIHQSGGTEGETLGLEPAMDCIRASHGVDVDPAVEIDPDASAGPAAAVAGVDSEVAATSTYGVRGEIARGGMGAIYKVRDLELRRSLAMKVLLGRSGDKRVAGAPVTSEDLNRFLEEAQVTAQLAHPGVVPVHQLGIDADGQVFFTMSLVRGKTLSEIIDVARAGAGGWSMTRALQVILRVCETVAFAHDKGVIHRDLKPANIMVGRFGETYVMDWGLAKVRGHEDPHDIRLKDFDPSTLSSIESRRSERTAAHDSPILTMDGAVVGTPAYMPPEQARGRVEDVDAQSDVYAIGAMLYELLTGQTPYVARGDRISPHTVLLAVHNGPPRPIHDVDPSAPEELQAVCEKAMERDRSKRYATAMELAEDLQRFLSGHVVRAHKTGALIELKKWIARNRGVAATAAVAIFTLAGMTAFFLQSVADERDRAKEAETREAERADEAELERSRAEGLALFMLNDLRTGLAQIGRLDLLSQVARESLDYYMTLGQGSLTDTQRKNLSIALTRVGDVFFDEGDLTRALESYEAAHRIRQLLVAEDPRSMVFLRALARSHSKIAAVKYERSELDAALVEAQTALEIQLRHQKENASDQAWQRDIAWEHQRIGDVYWRQGNLEGALGQYRESFELCLSGLGAQPESIKWRGALASSQEKVGNILREQGDVTGALENYRSARANQQSLVERDPSNVTLKSGLALYHDKVAQALRERGDVEGALTSQLAAVALAESLAAADPSNTSRSSKLAYYQEELGDIFESRREDERAIESFRASLDIRERLTALDPTNSTWQVERSWSLAKIGDVLLRQGHRVEALERFESAHGVFESLAAADPNNGTMQRALALLHVRLGDAKQETDSARALAHYGSALEILDHILKGEPNNLIWMLDLTSAHTHAGVMLHAGKNLDTALVHFQEALRVSRTLAPRAPATRRFQSSLKRTFENVAETLDTMGDSKGALAIRRQWVGDAARIAELDRTSVPPREFLALAHAAVAKTAQEQGDDQAALAGFRAGLEIWKLLSSEHPRDERMLEEQAWCLTGIGNRLRDLGDPEGALREFRAALAIRRRLADSDGGNAVRQAGLSLAHRKIAWVLVQQGDLRSALASYLQDLDVTRRLAAIEPEERARHRWTLRTIAELYRDLGDTENALAYFGELLEFVRAWATEAPADLDARSWVCWCHVWMGEVRKGRGELDEADTRFRTAVEIAEEIAASEPENDKWRSDLAACYERLGDVTWDRGRLAQAVAHYQKSIQIYDRQVEAEPGSAERWWAVSVVRNRIGRVQMEQRRYADGVTTLRESVVEHAKAVELDPSHEDMHGWWESHLRRAELIAGERDPTNTGDHLDLAYLRYDHGDYPGSVSAFTSALTDADARGDFTRANLYNAACSAALAANAGGEAAADYQGRALAWLRDDLQARSELLARIVAQLAAGEDDAGDLKARKAEILRHFEFARTGDSDLSVLRGTAEFDALFEGLRTTE